MRKHRINMESKVLITENLTGFKYIALLLNTKHQKLMFIRQDKRQIKTYLKGR